MRHPITIVAVLLSSAGCLRAPEGKPGDGLDAGADAAISGAWPDVGAPAIVALAAGDFDGDGDDDLIVVSAGGDGTAGPGVYLLKGGDDLTLTEDVPVISFSLFVAIPDLEAPVAAIALELDGNTDDGIDVVITYSDGGGMILAGLRGHDLQVLGDHSLGLSAASAGVAVWMAPVDFPPGMPRLAIAVEGIVKHIGTGEIPLATAMIGEVPMSMADPAWVDPQVLATYDDGGTLTGVMATETTLTRAPLPTQPPPAGMFTWTPFRTGDPWLGQIAADLGGTAPTIVGFEPAAPGSFGEICAANLDSGVLATCAPTNQMGDAPTELYLAAFTADANPDLVLLRPTGASATVMLGPNLMVNTGSSTVTTSPVLMPLVVDVPDALLGAGDFDDDLQDELVLIGRDGTSSCVGLKTTQPPAAIACADR